MTVAPKETKSEDVKVVKDPKVKKLLAKMSNTSELKSVKKVQVECVKTVEVVKKKTVEIDKDKTGTTGIVKDKKKTPASATRTVVS